MATQFNKFIDRNNFKFSLTRGAQLAGDYGFPKLGRTDVIPHDLVPFNLVKTEKAPANKWVHFFVDDYQFERIWNFPSRYVKLLKRFDGAIAPDFSMLDTMPKAQKIWNCYRNRALAYYLQSSGVNVVPAVGWAEYSDLDWCLDGLPIDSTLAMEIYGSTKSSLSRYGLLKGIERINNELMPRVLAIYGKEISDVNSICKNVVWVENYCKTIKNRV